HLAVGGSFVTGLYVVNTAPRTGSFSVAFYDDYGTPLALSVDGTRSLQVLTDTIAGGGAKYYEFGPPESPLRAGSGVITADSSITIQALFRRQGSDNSFFEAAVPSSVGINEFWLPFDATTFPATGAQIYTGVAIVNADSGNSANVQCTARDSFGNII